MLKPWWTNESLPKPTRDVARLKADMTRYGYCLVAEAFTSAQCAAIRERLAEQAVGEREQGHHRRSLVQDPGMVNQWVNMLLNKGDVFRTALHNPTIGALAEHILGKEYVLSDLAAHITRPGNSLLPLHTDQWWMPVPRMPEEDYVCAGDISRTTITIGGPGRSRTPINPPMVMNAMCMMSDFTEENGGTRLVPMSHLSGVQPDQSVPHTVPSVAAEGPAGTVVIWEGRTWHSAGENRSNADRFGLVSYYGAPQARQLANYTLGTKAHVLKDASPELLKLLGFKVWHGYGQTGTHGTEFAAPADQLIGEMRPPAAKSAAH